MAMKQTRAFNARMMSRMLHYRQEPGSYDLYNDWIEGKVTETPIMGVIQSGNKFSQFEEGIAVVSEDGGTRTSDYRSLYVHSRLGLELGDKIKYNNVYYNLLQQSDEATFGYDSFLLEKSKNWEPPHDSIYP